MGHSGDVGLQSHPLDTVPGDNLAVIGSNNFQSVKASHAVYKGKHLQNNLNGVFACELCKLFAIRIRLNENNIVLHIYYTK